MLIKYSLFQINSISALPVNTQKIYPYPWSEVNGSMNFFVI